MDFAINRLNNGNWVNIFPEGRISPKDNELLPMRNGFFFDPAFCFN